MVYVICSERRTIVQFSKFRTCIGRFLLRHSPDSKQLYSFLLLASHVRHSVQCALCCAHHNNNHKCINAAFDLISGRPICAYILFAVLCCAVRGDLQLCCRFAFMFARSSTMSDCALSSCRRPKMYSYPRCEMCNAMAPRKKPRNAHDTQSNYAAYSGIS